MEPLKCLFQVDFLRKKRLLFSVTFPSTSSGKNALSKKSVSDVWLLSHASTEGIGAKLTIFAAFDLTQKIPWEFDVLVMNKSAYN
jgi:hypothetical protein